MDPLKTKTRSKLIKPILILIVMFLLLSVGIQEVDAAQIYDLATDQKAIDRIFKISGNSQGVSFGRSISLPKLTYLFGLQIAVVGAIFYRNIYKSL